MVSVVENNFVGFSYTLGFKKITHKTLKTFISRSTIRVSSEIEVFDAIVNWIKYDKQYRKTFMCELLKTVRLPMLSSKIIRKLIKGNKLCQSCRKCCNHIENMIAIKQSLNKLFTKSLQHRCCINNFTHFKFPSHVASLSSNKGFKNLDEKFHNLKLKSFEFYRTKKIEEYHVMLYSSQTCTEITLDVLFVFFAACMFMNKFYVTGGMCWQNGEVVVCMCMILILQNGKD